MSREIARATEITAYEAAAAKWAVALNERYGIDKYPGRFESEHANYMGSDRRRIVTAWMGPMPQGPRWVFHLTASDDGDKWGPTMATFETLQPGELRFKKLDFRRLGYWLDGVHVQGKPCLVPMAVVDNEVLSQRLAKQSFYSREEILAIMGMSPSEEIIQAVIDAWKN